MEAGYEPTRVAELLRRTIDAIETLRAMTSDDPAAAEAIRTVRLTRNNLEDQWMPALRDLERSEAMVRWRVSRLGTFGFRSALADALPEHDRPVGVALSADQRDRLVAELDWLERVARSDDAANGAPTGTELAVVGRRLAFWVARDSRLADQLVELSVSNMLVGRLLGEARFAPSFASAVVRRMAVPNGPDTGVDPDRYAASLSAALASLADDPTACLDLLLHEPTAYALASWKALDTAVLADFVVSGLYESIATDPDRLADGYAVLAFLTRAANGPLDGGMTAGMALGVSTSLAGYIDTLAPAIRNEGTTPVIVHATSPPVELGTYDDLVDLFGALLRVREAQSALGTVLAAYTFETFERVGGGARTGPEVTYVAQVADLVGDAGRTEQAELVMAAAVEEARRRQLGGLIGFGSNAALLAGGAGAVARAIAGQAARTATNWTAQVQPEQLPDAQIPARMHDLITVAALGVVVSDPSTRRAAGLTRVNSAHWSATRSRLEDIERIDDPHERTRAIGALDFWIETSVPELAAYLVSIRSLPGMPELTEARAAVRTD